MPAGCAVSAAHDFSAGRTAGIREHRIVPGYHVAHRNPINARRTITSSTGFGSNIAVRAIRISPVLRFITYRASPAGTATAKCLS